MAAPAAASIALPTAGSTWKRLEEHGLPKGPYGRIGVAVAPNSDRIYALIEARNPMAASTAPMTAAKPGTW